MALLDLQVATANDAGSASLSGFVSSIWISGSSLGWIRFPGVSLPPLSQIDSAVLSVAGNANSGLPTWYSSIYGVAQDNPVRPATPSEMFDYSYPLTSAYLDLPPAMPVAINTWYDFAVANIVQEIVNRPGWEIGNALMFWWVGSNNLRQFQSYSDSPSYAPKLSVTYSEAIAPGGAGASRYGRRCRLLRP